MEGTINTVYATSSPRQIWVTEFGAAYQHLGNDKQQQAQYLENCYKLFEVLKDGNTRKMGVPFWFAWDDRTHYNPNAESFGLVEQDRSGRPDQWRRPAWYAYRRVSHPAAPGRVDFRDDFESGISRWSTYRENIAWSSSYSVSGSHSLYVQATGPQYMVKGGPTSGGACTLPFVEAYGLRIYEIAVWVRNPSQSSVEAMLYVQQLRWTT